ncbi:MAG: hypothetical protein A2Y33_12710 [Spirochaetes bacterium GWF1_51_8]|nr:MAG: hypothetical protein A2Y33_12710 [Spirochaetes bacterium GWF1_51_8]
MKTAIKSDPVIIALDKIVNGNKFPVSAVYLFGSRVSGNEKRDSDYDLFIVFKNSESKPKMILLRIEIKKRLKAYFPKLAFDILSRTESRFDEYKHIVNTIDNTVYENGKRII